MDPQEPQAAPSAIVIPDYVTQPLSQDEQARRQTMANAWKAYKGRFDPPLKKKDGKSAAKENTLSNRCAPIVNTGRDFLFGEKIAFEVGDPDDDDSDVVIVDAEAANKALCAAWGDDDDKMTLLGKIAMNGAICGHEFVRILPNPYPRHAPRLVNIDPQSVTMIVDDDDCETVYAYIIEYTVNLSKSVTITKRLSIWRVDPDGLAVTEGGYDPDSTWMMQAFEKRGENGKLQPVDDPIEWPYPFAPIVDAQNLPNPNEAYGLSDLPPELIGINESLNFSQSNTAKILKFHAHPKTIVTGADAAQVQAAVEDVTCLPEGADAKLLEMHGDLASSMAFQDNLRSDMDEQSAVPAVALGRIRDLPLGNISGVAIQILYRPLVQKTTIKRRLYGKLIREVCRRVLTVMGVMEYDPYLPIEIHWPDLLPVDDMAAAQTAMALDQLGVSKETLLTRLGFDAKAELAKNADEAAQAMKNFGRGQGLPPQQPPQTPNSQQDNSQEKEPASQNGNAE